MGRNDPLLLRVGDMPAKKTAKAPAKKTASKKTAARKPRHSA
ncbi:hypothetical protein [Streptomyces sp. NPDC002172]